MEVFPFSLKVLFVACSPFQSTLQLPYHVTTITPLAATDPDPQNPFSSKISLFCSWHPTEKHNLCLNRAFSTGATTSSKTDLPLWSTGSAIAIYFEDCLGTLSTIDSQPCTASAKASRRISNSFEGYSSSRSVLLSSAAEASMHGCFSVPWVMPYLLCVCSCVFLSFMMYCVLCFMYCVLV